MRAARIAQNATHFVAKPLRERSLAILIQIKAHPASSADPRVVIRHGPHRGKDDSDESRTVRNTHAGSNTAIFRELRLERLTLLPKNVPSAVNDTLKGWRDKRTRRCEMTFQIVEWNLHGCSIPLALAFFAY